MSFKRIVQAAKSILTLNRDREFVELKRMLALKSTDRVLDAGCGEGTYLARACEHGAGWLVAVVVQRVARSALMMTRVTAASRAGRPLAKQSGTRAGLM